MGVAANRVKNQSRSADRGCSSRLDVGFGLTATCYKSKIVKKCHIILGYGGILWINDLYKGEWT
jgi:hypothetical protein